MTSCKLLVIAAMSAALVGGAGVVPAYTGEELAKDAKLTLFEARTIALKSFPGKVIDEELEKEEGGSGLRYSFDIKNGSVTHEVGVDAKTGKLLENNPEGPHAGLRLARNVREMPYNKAHTHSSRTEDSQR